MFLNYWPIVCILTVGAICSILTKKLTITAGVFGWLTGFLVFAGAGYTGVAMMGAFFLLGTFATSFGLHKKQQLGLAEKDKGKRTWGQVIANAGVPAILGLLTFLFPQKLALLQIMMAAGFASATADTLSSELGNLYGSRYFNIITFKKEKRGLDGVISAEGTAIGITGSAVIAVIFTTDFGWSIAFLIIIIAGTIGNLSDSLLGATLERKTYLNNNTVNFLNTTLAALSALLLYYAWFDA